MHAMGIDDAYRVERVLVRNANGATELVTIEDVGPFVRKKMPTERANRAVWAALAGNDCPRLPQVAATYEMPDCFVAVYDYVPGETLEDAVVRSGTLDAATAVRIARDVCEALAALHGCGVVHLDVSPANVLLAADGAHLIDFGNARLVSSDAVRAQGQGRPKGTWGFAAPEQFFHKADVRSDVFAVGRLLGYMLTGIHPDEDRIAEFEAAVEDSSRVPMALGAVISCATDFEPSARYREMGEFARALDVASRGEVMERESRLDGPVPPDGEARPAAESRPGVPAGPAPAQPRAPRCPSGATRIATVVLACAAALMSVVVGIKVLSGRADDDAPVIVNPVKRESPTDAAAEPSLAGPTAEQLARAHESLGIVESGWGVSAGGYVMYALTLENTSDDLVVEYPEVLITGRDEDGSVLFTDSQVLWVIYPGEQLTYACQAGNGQAPATVEFALAAPQDYQVTVGEGEATTFEVSDFSVRAGSYGSTLFTGEVTTVSQGDEGDGMGDVWLSVILRDEAGKIVYADHGDCRRPGEGKSSAFEIDVYDCPAYATAEVVGMAW